MGDSAFLDIPTNSNWFFPQWTSLNEDEEVYSISCDTCRRTYVRPLITTEYEFLVITDEGCEQVTYITVNVKPTHLIHFPKAFTPFPASPGENDFLYPQSNEEVKQVDVFRLYNRWGNLVFETYEIDANDPNVGWDGTLKGKLLPSDIYIWQVEVTFIDGYQETFAGETILGK